MLEVGAEVERDVQDVGGGRDVSEGGGGEEK